MKHTKTTLLPSLRHSGTAFRTAALRCASIQMKQQTGQYLTKQKAEGEILQ